jgi:superfamily II DNA or RNA helicase
MGNITLRPYQTEAVQSIRAEWERGVHATLAVLATGAGKTEIALATLSQELQAGKVGRILFLVHTIELVRQPVERIDKSWPEFFGMTGMVQAENNEVYARFICATWQSLSRGRMEDLLAFGNITHLVIDECHRSTSEGISAIVKKLRAVNPEMRVLGMTATPVRSDKSGLSKIFESVAYKFSISTAIKTGALTPFNALGVQLPADISEVKETREGYDDEQMGAVLSAENILEIVFQNWKQFCEDRQTIAFTASVAQAEKMSDFFNKQGIVSDWICGETEKSKRRGIIERFKRGEIRVLFNVFVLVEGFDCLDDQTEILTPDGWRGMDQIIEGENCYSLNRETGKMEITPIEKYMKRAVRPAEQMVTIKSQHVNVRVTEGHQFHIKYPEPKKPGLSKSWQTKTGRELLSRKSHYALPISAELENLPGVPLTDDEIRFIAWFMTDGTRDNNHRSVCISQAKEYHYEIRSLLQRLGFDFTERLRNPGKGTFANAKPCYEFRVPKGTDHGSKKRNGWDKYDLYLDKNISPLLHQMTREQFAIFWEELLKGDGSQSENHSGWLWCDRKEQADTYTHLAVVRGFSASFQEEITAHGTSVWRVSVRDKQWITSTPSDPRSGKITAEDPHPGEFVWCVRNRNSTLVTRRNGKIVIIGNCPATSAIMMIAPTKSDLVYVQRLGRGLRLFPGKADCMVLDFAPVGSRNIIMAGDVLGIPQAQKKAQAKADKQGVLFAFNIDAMGQTSKIDPSELIVRVLDLLGSHYLAWYVDEHGAVASIGSNSALYIELPDLARLQKAEAVRTSGAWKPEYDEAFKRINSYGLWLVENGNARFDAYYPSMEEAKTRGDSIAEPRIVDILGAKDKSWRRMPATDRQLAMMTRLKVTIPPNCKKGQAAQIITAHLTAKAVSKAKLGAWVQ